MEAEDFEVVLNRWEIYDENERWSYKRLFQQECDDELASINDFSEFISRQLSIIYQK